jgi:hypothetical protein
MKRFLSILFLSLSFFVSKAQNRSILTNELRAKDSLELPNGWIKGKQSSVTNIYSNTPANWLTQLPTIWGLKDYTPATIRAAWINVRDDGSDKTAVLQAALDAGAPELLFDEPGAQIKIDDTLWVPNTAKLIFRNGAKIYGAGAVMGGIIDARPKDHIFDLSGGLSIRKLKNLEVSGRWFGMIPNAWYHDQPSATDNTPFLEAAIAAIDERIDATVYIPGVDSFTVDGLGFWYKMTTIEITRDKVTIYGDYRSSVLIFSGDTLGIKLTGQYSALKRLKIMGKYGGGAEGYNDFTAPGVWCNGGDELLEDIEVLGFDGSGIEVYGDVLTAGNSNLTKLNRVHCYTNGQAGIYVHGGDANAVAITDPDCQGNARFGIWDKSFLGITVRGGHLDGNGVENAVQRSNVSYAGSYWAALKDNTNVTPGTDPTTWKEVLFYGFATVAWSSSVDYKVGCGFYMDDPNQVSIITGCYSEGNEINILTGPGGSKSISISGFLSSYGAAPNSMGVRNGFITANNLQAWDNATNVGVYLWGEAGRFGFHDADNNLFPHFYYNKTYGWITYAQGEGTASRTMFLTSRAGMDAALSGPTAFQDRIALTGFFLGREDAGGHRMFTGSTAMPSGSGFGEQSVGGWSHNLGSANNVIGWKTIAYTSGANGPNTWRAILARTSSMEVAYASTWAPNAASATTQWIELTGNMTIDPPTGGVDRQRLTIELKQDATGGRTVTWDAIYVFPTDFPTPTLSTAAGYWDKIEFELNEREGTYDCVGYVLGYHN